MTFKLVSNIPEYIFRAYDIRGIVDTVLTPDVVYSLGLAIGSEARGQHQHKLIVGRDGRLSSPLLCDAVKQGITDSGCDVIDIHEVPTPVLYFATHKLGPGVYIEQNAVKNR